MLGLLSPSWTTYFGSLALLAALGGPACLYAGYSFEHDRGKVALAKSVDKAREAEANWQIAAEAITEVHTDELRRIAADHVRDLDGLRSRSARLPETSRSACNGATGSQLSRDDAAFLVGFAAERDAEASDLRACQAWVRSVTGRAALD